MSDTIDEVKPVEAPAVVNTEYDTPPKEYVPGTVVPKDTAPEDMTMYPPWFRPGNWQPKRSRARLCGFTHRNQSF